MKAYINLSLMLLILLLQKSRNNLLTLGAHAQ